MSWLGSAATDLYSLLMNKKFKNGDDVVKADSVKLARSGVGAQAHVTAYLFIKMMGLRNVKVITGYMGGEAELPIEYTPGEETAQMVKKMLQLSSDVVPLIKEAYGIQ